MVCINRVEAVLKASYTKPDNKRKRLSSLELPILVEDAVDVTSILIEETSDLEPSKANSTECT